VVRMFFIWYTPLYKRMCVQVARADELHGDNYMMDLVNDRDVAELMSAQIIAERYLKEHYGPAILEQARKRPNPSPIIYSGIDRKFNRYWCSADAKRWLQLAFANEPAAHDPRPSLRRRLAEIGHSSPRVPTPLRQAASRVLLEGALKPVMAKLDRVWMRRVANDWRELHQKAKQETRRLGLLHKKSRTQKLTSTEARELALLVERCHGKAKARPFFTQLLKLHAKDAGAYFVTGRYLLSLGEDQGKALLDKAISLDDRFAQRATRLIDDYEAEKRRVAADTGEFPSISDTQLPIIVTESPEVVTETAIRKAVSQIGEHGAVTDEGLLATITDPGARTQTSLPAGVTGLRGVISETGMRGAAAIETGLLGTVSQTGQPGLAAEKAESRATTQTGLHSVPDTGGSDKDRSETNLDKVLAKTGVRAPIAGGAGLQKAVFDDSDADADEDSLSDTTPDIGKSAAKEEKAHAYAVLRASVTGERLQVTTYKTGTRKVAPEPVPEGVDDRSETDLDKALAATAARNSVTAAGLQSAITDSAIRKAVTNTELRKAN